MSGDQQSASLSVEMLRNAMDAMEQRAKAEQHRRIDAARAFKEWRDAQPQAVRDDPVCDLIGEITMGGVPIHPKQYEWIVARVIELGGRPS